MRFISEAYSLSKLYLIKSKRDVRLHGKKWKESEKKCENTNKAVLKNIL